MFFLLLVGRRKKEREKWPGAFFPGPEARNALGFSQLLGAIKGRFKGQSLNFICT
jgi:hypothetical protein